MSCTYEEIRKKYPSHTYRVSYNVVKDLDLRWIKNSGPLGAMAPCLCYVLAGEVTYQFGDQEIKITAGECKDLPGGEYSLYLGQGDAEIVKVWKLPLGAQS